MNAIVEGGYKGIHVQAESNPNVDILKTYNVSGLPKYFIISKQGTFADKPTDKSMDALKTVLRNHLNEN